MVSVKGRQRAKTTLDQSLGPFQDVKNQILPGPACLKCPPVDGKARSGCQWPTERLQVCMDRLPNLGKLQSVHWMVDSAGEKILRQCSHASALFCGAKCVHAHLRSLQSLAKAVHNTLQCASRTISLTRPRKSRRQQAGLCNSGGRQTPQRFQPTALSYGMSLPLAKPHLRR